MRSKELGPSPEELRFSSFMSGLIGLFFFVGGIGPTLEIINLGLRTNPDVAISAITQMAAAGILISNSVYQFSESIKD